MAEAKITITDQRLLAALGRIARRKGLSSIDELLSQLVADQIIKMGKRINDPMIGFLSNGEIDLSEREEEILRAGWNPD